MSTLERPGASLYYDVAGESSRPTVLFMLGGLDEGGAVASVVHALERDYHLISYDRRGLGRSTEDDPSSVGNDRITAHADDAAALVNAVAEPGQSVHIVSVCLGGLIGLRLLERHPQIVRSLSIHEPPIETLACEPARVELHDEIATLAVTDPRKAGAKFADATGRGDPLENEAVTFAPRAGNIEADVRHFFAHDYGAVRSYRPDLDRIKSGTSVKIYATGGIASRGRFEYECTRVLAQSIGVPFEEIPGGHAPLITHPVFSERLVRARLAIGLRVPPEPGATLDFWGYPWFRDQAPAGGPTRS